MCQRTPERNNEPPCRANADARHPRHHGALGWRRNKRQYPVSLDVVRPTGGGPVSTIAEWLASLGMSEYSERFAEERIEIDVLSELTDRNLERLGIPLSNPHRPRDNNLSLLVTGAACAPG